MPNGGVLPPAAKALCFGNVVCHGLPPTSCEAFGPKARMSADPRELGRCLACENVEPGPTITLLVLVLLTMLICICRFLFVITREADEKSFKGWIATASIVIHSCELVFVVASLLVVEIAAPAIAQACSLSSSP